MQSRLADPMEETERDCGDEEESKHGFNCVFRCAVESTLGWFTLFYTSGVDCSSQYRRYSAGL